ncbi:flagellar biosynthesis protein FlhF [Halomonas sp. HMF6819]|uniref:flagellar biosynthesis protein FlhF n=1 Tax=Halomonas sp. HMF6819 TaxID=3373085 RepID=UPI0037B99FD5
MSVRRFIGANSRDVMRQVRAALGDEALIVANRRTDTGVEILAMAEDAALDHAVPTMPQPAVEPYKENPADVDRPYARVAAALEASPPAAPASASQPFEAVSERLLQEMQDMRALLARTHVASAPAPSTAQTLNTLLARVGFGNELCEEVSAALPDSLSALSPQDERVLEWLHRQLIARLKVQKSEEAFFDQTGIVALVGPTGVGKTTTTAKLAARFVMRHGTRPVALVTTDSFRIGAHEQLRIYARLLDTPMYALDHEQPIDDLLGRLGGKQWVIIDTVGMSQRDQRVITQIDQLQGGGSKVRLVLVLNAASQPETLEEVVLRYRQAARAAGAELDDCIITKQDEAGRLAPLLDIVMRFGLRVLFCSNGQRVPEDMQLAEPTALVDQALTHAMTDAHTSEPARPAWSSEALAPRWSREVLGQGRRLSLLMASLRERVAGFSLLEASWDIAALPGVLHDQRLAALADRSQEQRALGVVWSPRRAERGMEWSMPDLNLDADGRLCALTLLQHRQSAGWPARIDAQRQAAVHLLPTLVEGDTLDALEAERLTWVSRVSASQRVYWQGERYAMTALFDEATLGHHVPVRFRGQSLALYSAHAEVTDAAGRTLLAWSGELRDPETSRRVAKRYWLTPARLGSEALSLLITQLQGEGTIALTKRVWRALKESDGGEVSAELRLLMASGVACVAAHLDSADDEEARVLQQDLLRLLGSPRKRRDSALADALMHLLMTRDAIRQFGSVSREAFA